MATVRVPEAFARVIDSITHCEVESVAHRLPLEQTLVWRARYLLHENVEANLPLAEIAEKARSSKFHLIRRFRSAFGFSPHAYLLRLRVAKAKRRLAKGQAISEVAHGLGFFDQSHFSRAFKRFLGVSPGEYRKEMLELLS